MPINTFEWFGAVSVMCVCLLLQGHGAPEGAPAGDTLVPPQPGERHSFVQEHFQAQYK